jgi:hypothetical protein
MNGILEFLNILWQTSLDILPLLTIILGFQVFILKKPLLQVKQLLVGLALVILGLSFFLDGLELALFPIGRLMATQLIEMELAGQIPGIDVIDGLDFTWLFIFAFLIGFSTTIAEPALIAVAIKANQVSGGAIGVWGLRLVVALGVAIGISIGVFRIISGYPIHWFIVVGYMIVIIQTFYSPKFIVPLAYDSGGVTTSTVTVPLVAALGLGLAETIPGRSPLIDGFGLIAFASLFPMITVMAYAQLGASLGKWKAHEIRN